MVALKAMMIHNKRILTVQRSLSDDIDPGTWEFPGGKLEFGEPLRDGLQREIREETGLAAQTGRLLYAASFLTDPGRQVVLLTYLCTCEETDVRLSEEHEDFLWATKAQLAEKINPDILTDLEENSVFDLPELTEAE